MRIGFMTAAAFTLARPIRQQKNRKGIAEVLAKRSFALCPPFSWNWRNFAVPGHRYENVLFSPRDIAGGTDSALLDGGYTLRRRACPPREARSGRSQEVALNRAASHLTGMASAALKPSRWAATCE
jgi:hypothetical protein